MRLQRSNLTILPLHWAVEDHVKCGVCRQLIHERKNVCAGGERHVFPGTLPLCTKRLLIIVMRDLVCTQTLTHIQDYWLCATWNNPLLISWSWSRTRGRGAPAVGSPVEWAGSGRMGMKEKEAVALSRNQTHSPHRVKRFSNGITHTDDTATPLLCGTKVCSKSTLNQIPFGAFTPQYAAGELWS